MNNQLISISKAKKAITDYKKAIGRPDGMAKLSIFYCEEAFGFLESCSMEDESYFVALIRMYGRIWTPARLQQAGWIWIDGHNC